MAGDWLKKSRLTRKLTSKQQVYFLPRRRTGLVSYYLYERSASKQPIGRLCLRSTCRPFPQPGADYKGVCRIAGRPYRLVGDQDAGVEVSQDNVVVCSLSARKRGSQQREVQPKPPWAEEVPHSLHACLTFSDGQRFWVCSRHAAFHGTVFLADAEACAVFSWSISGDDFRMAEDFSMQNLEALLALCWYLATIRFMEHD